MQEGTLLKPAIHDETGTCKVTSDILSRVGDKWSILVVVCLAEKPHRFGELRRFIGNISQKMLTSTLRNLERDGFVAREVEPCSPPKVTYSLTPFGHELKETAVGFAMWVAGQTDRILEAQRAFDDRN